MILIIFHLNIRNTTQSEARVEEVQVHVMHSFKQHRTKCHPRLLLTNACFHI